MIIHSPACLFMLPMEVAGLSLLILTAFTLRKRVQQLLVYGSLYVTLLRTNFNSLELALFKNEVRKPRGTACWMEKDWPKQPMLCVCFLLRNTAHVNQLKWITWDQTPFRVSLMCRSETCRVKTPNLLRLSRFSYQKLGHMLSFGDYL